MRSRIFGEEFIDKFEINLCDFLKSQGYNSIAPMRLKSWQRIEDDKLVFTSNWSHRHMAYACGLGTFGLCDGFITEKGKAVRLGSIITDFSIPQTKRLYENHTENCLFYKNGKCVSCIKRCPANAISEKGHDKNKCYEFINTNVIKNNQKYYNLGRGGCGLCQTGVPCESTNPVK